MRTEHLRPSQNMVDLTALGRKYNPLHARSINEGLDARDAANPEWLARRGESTFEQFKDRVRAQAQHQQNREDEINRNMAEGAPSPEALAIYQGAPGAPAPEAAPVLPQTAAITQEMYQDPSLMARLAQQLQQLYGGRR